MTRFVTKFALATAVLSIGEFAVAQTTAPTKKPTSAPTNKPTSAPTKKPTSSPTIAPTKYLGTGEWYADTANGNLCSKDCAPGDLDCGGINHDTATWLTDTYTTAKECCQKKFAYLDADYCADRSKASPSGTSKYYADSTSNKCKIDSSGSLGPFQSGTLFADAASCCTGGLGWINKDFCVSRTAGGYTDKWYVDYSDMVCKKDCATSGGVMCEPTTDGYTSNTLFADAKSCCQGKLGYIPVTTCETVSTTGVAAGTVATDKFYADYSSTPARCAKDCDTTDPACGGILSNVAGVQMFDDSTACCKAKFSWMDQKLCQSLTTAQSTSKWYVDYQNNKCVQDCTKATNSPCGGPPPDLSMQLFDSAETCCTTKLGWVQKGTCTSVSTNAAAAATGSLKYYADYSSSTCKKDCVASAGSPECGGVKSNTAGEQLFDTIDTCCSAKFGWINKDLCKIMSTGGYTNKFYVDYADNACKQDCATGTANKNCGGNPGDKSIQLFDTAASCCSSKLSYLNQDACKSKSETGAVTAAAGATGSSKWYIDWSISKCVKDCAKGSDTECGGLAESWEPAEYSDWTSCCKSRLSWVKTADCHL